MCITPGPWRVEGHKDSLMPAEIVKDFPTAGEYGLVCELTHSLFRENQRDNARLIAAAPDLLEVLKDIEARMSRHGSGDVILRSKIQAAIRKAEGKEG